MTNKASSFPAAPAIGPLDRYGGKIAALGELPIHALGNDYTIDGNGTVNSLPALAAGVTITARITGSPTFTHSARLICQSGVSYSAAPGDFLFFRSDGDGAWRLYAISRPSIYAAPFDALAYNGMQVNGSCEVDQVNVGGLVSNVNGYAIDGMKVIKTGTMVLASQQVADAPAGLTN
jgi:hypothetical protein